MSFDRAFFEGMYAREADPWGFATSAYEAAKYEATLGVLGEERFGAGFEIGCSIGVLTRMLAERCEQLLAVDVAEAAVVEARARCAGLPVEVRRMQVPAEWPEGVFDLIVVSEVLYYLGLEQIGVCGRLAQRSLAAGGAVVLVHYTGQTDSPVSGDAAAEAFMAAAGGLRVTRQRQEERYRLDLLRG